MKVMVIGVPVLAQLFVWSAAAAPPGGNVGTPEAFVADVPLPPGSVDEDNDRYAADLKVLQDRLASLVPVVGGPQIVGTEPEVMAFMHDWPQQGLTGGEKIYHFKLEQEKVGATEGACIQAEMRQNIPDHHPGLVRCANGYLGGIKPIWPELVQGTHDVIVEKANYIAKFRQKAKSAAFKAFLDTQYQGLWIHVENLMSWVQDTVNHGHV